MAIEFWSVHALDFSDAGLVFPLMLNAHRILEHVRAARQVIDKEMRRCVTRGFVIPKPVLDLIS